MGLPILSTTESTHVGAVCVVIVNPFGSFNEIKNNSLENHKVAINIIPLDNTNHNTP